MRRLLSLSVLALVLAACDTGSALDQTVILTKTRTAVFSYACDARGAGQAHTVAATAGITFVGGLDGFNAADVLSATLTSATLTRRVPSGSNLDGLVRNVQLALGASNVAGLATPPASTTTALTTTGADVAALVRAGTFTPALSFTVVQPQATECRLEADLTFRIELPGV